MYIVESCSLTKLNGGLSRLHSADEDAVSWLTNYYGSWHAYEKKQRGSNDKLWCNFCAHQGTTWLITTFVVVFARCLCSTVIFCILAVSYLGRDSVVVSVSREVELFCFLPAVMNLILHCMMLHHIAVLYGTHFIHFFRYPKELFWISE